MAQTELQKINEQIRELRMKLIAVDKDLAYTESHPGPTWPTDDPKDFKSLSVLKKDRSIFQAQLEFLSTERSKLQKGQKPKVAKGKKHKYEIIKEEFEKLKKAHPKKSTEDILRDLADNRDETFSAVKKAYYHKT